MRCNDWLISAYASQKPLKVLVIFEAWISVNETEGICRIFRCSGKHRITAKQKTSRSTLRLDVCTIDLNSKILPEFLNTQIKLLIDKNVNEDQKMNVQCLLCAGDFSTRVWHAKRYRRNMSYCNRDYDVRGDFTLMNGDIPSCLEPLDLMFEVVKRNDATVNNEDGYNQNNASVLKCPKRARKLPPCYNVWSRKGM